MYWNAFIRTISNFSSLISFNMGCIETWDKDAKTGKKLRLTLTWDVLKRSWSMNWTIPWQINFNMGCIETQSSSTAPQLPPWLTLTWDVLKLLLILQVHKGTPINFNMGCIETRCFSPKICRCHRLTLTWDVLKPGHLHWRRRRRGGLTLTWDVLKRKKGNALQDGQTD